MKRLYTWPVMVALALTAVACDSGDDEPTDAEMFVGTYKVSKIENNLSQTGTGGTDVTAGVICATPNSGPTQTNPCGVNTINLSFSASGTYQLTVDYTNTANAAGRADVTIPATGTAAYTVNEANGQVTLVVPPSTNVLANYTIASDGDITLLVPAAIFNSIFVTQQYTGYVRITLDKQ